MDRTKPASVMLADSVSELDGSLLPSHSMDSPVQLLKRQGITISCHENEIPSFVEQTLSKLYGHIHSSLPFFRIFRPADNVSTYAVWQNGQPITVFLFRREKVKLDIYNEMIHLDGDDVDRCAGFLFEKFPDVNIISFKAVHIDTERFAFPVQRQNAKENSVIVLPPTPEQYTASLGKSTRENVKRYRKRLTQDFPSFNYRLCTGDEIDENDLHAILRLSEARMSVKKKRFGIDETEAECIIRLAKTCGVVGVLTIEGRVVAGLIGYRVGFECLAEVIAHDSRYDDYWIGTLCYYLTICECIARGARKFHLGGGRNDYKRRLAAVREDMDRIEIYRSRKHQFMHCGHVLKLTAEGQVRRLKVWLLTREKSTITQSVLHALHLLRKFTKR